MDSLTARNSRGSNNREGFSSSPATTTTPNPPLWATTKRQTRASTTSTMPTKVASTTASMTKNNNKRLLRRRFGVSKQQQGLQLTGLTTTLLLLACAALFAYHVASSSFLSSNKDNQEELFVSRNSTLSSSSVASAAAATMFLAKHPPFVPSPVDQMRHAMYRPEDDPIFSSQKESRTTRGISQSPIIRIRVLLFQWGKRRKYFRSNHSDPLAMMSDEVSNICVDGWQNSPYFQPVNNDTYYTLVPDYHYHDKGGGEGEAFRIPEDENVVWVVDMRRYHKATKEIPYTILDQLMVLTNDTLRYEKEQRHYNNNHRATTTTAATTPPPQLRIVLMDFRDFIPVRIHCTEAVQQLIGMLGPENFRIVLQQTVVNRHWDVDANFVHLGSIFDATPTNACLGGHHMLQAPYTVRTEIAETVHRMHRQFLPLPPPQSSDQQRMTTTRMTPVDTVRPIDVSHFWDYQFSKIPGPGVGRSAMACNLRNLVTRTVQGLASHKYKVIAKKVSPLDRRSVGESYVEALLRSKIVVVAQRDTWEDHYRLFEALAGGALVLTDPMLTLPSGLVDRESIVIYQSEQQLKDLLLYYLDHEQERLAIARKGWEVAMTQHRSHHWMERLFFGKILTP